MSDDLAPPATLPPGAALYRGRADLARDVARLGAEVSAARAERPPLLVGVLTSSLWFLADLVRAMQVPVEVDFVALNTFKAGSGARLDLDLTVDVTGRDVVLVEVLVETGLSLSFLTAMLTARGADRVEVCTLFDRARRRIVPVPVAYRGGEVGDEYLVGYGLGIGGLYRHVPDVYALPRAP